MNCVWVHLGDHVTSSCFIHKVDLFRFGFRRWTVLDTNRFFNSPHLLIFKIGAKHTLQISSTATCLQFYDWTTCRAVPQFWSNIQHLQLFYKSLSHQTYDCVLATPKLPNHLHTTYRKGIDMGVMVLTLQSLPNYHLSRYFCKNWNLVFLILLLIFLLMKGQCNSSSQWEILRNKQSWQCGEIYWLESAFVKQSYWRYISYCSTKRSKKYDKIIW